MPAPRQLLHTEWFDQALQSLGHLPNIDGILAEDLYRISVYADLVACAPGSSVLRIYQTRMLLQEDGQLIRLLIYFVLRPDNTVELQHIEPIKAEM